MNSKLSAADREKIKEAISQMIQDDKDNLTFNKALSMDIDAFLWTARELEHIWEDLIYCANDPKFETVSRIAAELWDIINEVKAFAQDTQDDIKTLDEKEAGNNEQDPVNAGDG